jgi:hypothetical protein
MFRVGNTERKASVCCTNSRGSETHPHNAHRTPSTCAAREWEQSSQRLLGLFTTWIFIKSDAQTPEFFSA